MPKLDLRQEFQRLYGPKGAAPHEVDVPPFSFLMVDGQGDPNTSKDYSAAVEALFSVAYGVKFKVRNSSGGVDYAVMPLEGLWWADDPSSFVLDRKDRWRWTMMILQPSFVPAAMIESVMAEVRERMGLPGLARLRLETFAEGRCAQLLHVGPFADEGPAIERLHGFIDGIGARRGKHHEIYLSDIRRSAPAKWRTIIRQPFA